MSDTAEVTDIRPPVQFTIDGRPYESTQPRQSASALLRLAGLDPVLYELGELRGRRPVPVRYADAEIVDIHPGARFVSIRKRANVA